MTFGLELVLAGALWAPAQPPAAEAERRTALYEDIEVMRQLLLRKLGGRMPVVRAAANDPFAAGDLTFTEAAPDLAANTTNHYLEPLTTLDGTTEYQVWNSATSHQAVQNAYARNF